MSRPAGYTWIIATAVCLEASGVCAVAGPGQIELVVGRLNDESVERFDLATGEHTGSFEYPSLWPTGMVAPGDGFLYVNDVWPSHPVIRFDLSTGQGSAFTTGTQADLSIGLAFGPDGNLYRTHDPAGFIRQYDGQSGAYLGDFAEIEDGGATHGVVFGPDENLYVARHRGAFEPGEILRFDGQTGDFMDVFAVADAAGGLRGITFGPDGDLYASFDASSPGVLRFDGVTGQSKGVFADGAGVLDMPDGLGFGPDGNVYVSGHYSGNVARFDGMTGQFVDVFAQVVTPTYLTFIPEPRTAILLAIGALAVPRRR